MEEKGIEWSCPNCKKKRVAEVKEAAKKQVEQKKTELKKSNSQDLIKTGPAKSDTKETRSGTQVIPGVHIDDSGLSGTGPVTQWVQLRIYLSIDSGTEVNNNDET